MDKEDVLFLKSVRRRIIEICDYIYKQKWDEVYKSWKILNPKIYRFLKERGECREILDYSAESLKKGNFLRFHDLLLYELDIRFEEQLCKLTEKDRKVLAELYRQENEEALETYHEELLQIMHDADHASRITCSYTGADNVSMSIIEGSHSFQLFSYRNPWRESFELADGMKFKMPDRIYVLGFGGGHTVGELQRRFPAAAIKVYLPNKDIFKAVLFHMAEKEILENRNTEFYLDSACIGFFSDVNKEKRKNNNFGFYIDRQELRACTGSAAMTDKIISRYKKEKAVVREADSGKKIHDYIKGLVING